MPPYTEGIFYSLLAPVFAVRERVGLPVCTPGGEDDSGTCDEHAVPILGPAVGVERGWSFGCEFAEADWTVRGYVILRSLL